MLSSSHTSGNAVLKKTGMSRTAFEQGVEALVLAEKQRDDLVRRETKIRMESR